MFIAGLLFHVLFACVVCAFFRIKYVLCCVVVCAIVVARGNDTAACAQYLRQVCLSRCVCLIVQVMSVTSVMTRMMRVIMVFTRPMAFPVVSSCTCFHLLDLFCVVVVMLYWLCLFVRALLLLNSSSVCCW